MHCVEDEDGLVGSQCCSRGRSTSHNVSTSLFHNEKRVEIMKKSSVIPLGRIPQRKVH